MPDKSRSTATLVCVDGAPRARPGRPTPLDALLALGGRRFAVGSGDALVAFSSAADAIEASIAIQRRFVASCPLRIAIAAGDVLGGDRGRTATVVATARRLGRCAAPGQIIVASAVVALVRGVLDVPCRPLDADDGEGFEVQWSAGSLPATGLPAPLAVAVELGERFVGRERERAVLEQAWTDVLAGAQRLVLVSGGAGAGKTRLVAEFAAQVHRCGGRVLYGGCEAGARPSYEPWVHALGAKFSAALVEQRAPESDDDIDTVGLSEAVVLLLAASARDQPVLVVLDDIHWAGARTLALLRHVAHVGHCAHALVVCTHRDAVVDSDDAFVSYLSEMHRLSGVLRVRVGALDQAAVEALLTGDDAHERDDLRALAEAITERCGGNAFYVLELWRHLVATGQTPTAHTPIELAWTAVPDGVKELLEPRLRGLSPQARVVVEMAALVGDRVDLELVREATAIDDEQLAASVDELVAADLLGRPAALAGDRCDDYRFAHRLVRDAVEEATSPLTRARLHLRVADALVRLHGDGDASVAADLARHYDAAAPFDGHGKAVHYLELAGRSVRAAPAIAGPADRRGGSLSTLSPREVDVLRLVAEGRSNREIGAQLYISANTAANHVRAILRKTGCANRAQAVAFAARRHLLDEPV